MTTPRTLIVSTVTVGLSVAAVLAVGGCKHKTGGSGKLRIGFVQEGNESGWRAANTASVRAAGPAADVDLRFTDGGGEVQKQVAALQAFLAQRMDVVAFAPKEEVGWDPILRELKAAHIPVITSDRTVTVTDPSLQPVYIGSDLYEEGRRAGEWLAKKTNGTATIVILEGTLGAAATTKRTNGFKDAIKGHDGMKIVVTRNADFEQDKGKTTMASILATSEGKGLTALYAENDNMALGAILALAEAGKRPGTDVVVVSVDAIKEGLHAVATGTINCTIECNPLLGPKIMEIAKKMHAGEHVEPQYLSEEKLIDDPAEAKRMYDERLATHSDW